jgi:hypothetical protein
MWSIDNRGRYDRSKLRYPSDLTDDEWALIDPLIPAAKRGGNKRTVVECRATIWMRSVLPHPGMLPNGPSIASPECSRHGVILSIGKAV